MPKTLNALNLSTSALERAVSRELKKVNGGTVVIRNVGNAVSVERVARLAMEDGWDVGCSKKGNYFLVTLSKGAFEGNGLQNTLGFAN